MKLHRLLILSGLLIGAAPGISYAGCATACVLPDVCRITLQGPPAVYQCGLPSDRVLAGARGPSGTLTAKQGTGNVTGKGPVPNNSAARTSDPTVEPRAPAKSKSEVSIESVTSPRDASSGLPSVRRKQPQ